MTTTYATIGQSVARGGGGGQGIGAGGLYRRYNPAGDALGAGFAESLSPCPHRQH